MSETAQALAMASEFEWRGRKWKLAPFTLDMAAEFTVWCESRAWERVERQKGAITDEVYNDRHTAVTRLICGGEFDYGKPIVASMALTVDGMKRILYQQLRGENEDVTEKLASDMLDEMFVEVQARMRAQGFDPNLSAPAGTTSAAVSASGTLPPSSPGNLGAIGPGKSDA